MSRSRNKTPAKIWHKYTEPLCQIIRKRSTKRLRQEKLEIIPDGGWWKKLASDMNIDFYRRHYTTRQDIETYKRFYIYK